MLSINGGYGCSYPMRWCVKNLTLATIVVCFLLTVVFFKRFLTQFIATLNTATYSVITLLKNSLYTLTTTLITSTKYLNIFCNYCWI